MLKYLLVLLVFSSFMISCNEKTALLHQDLKTLDGTMLSKDDLEKESVFFWWFRCIVGIVLRIFLFITNYRKTIKKIYIL